MNKTKTICTVLLVGTLFGACTTTGVTKVTGTTGGAALGAIVGQIVGKDTKGTLIGAGVGALAGLGWGAYKDQQKAEFQRRLNSTSVTITDEGASLKLNLPDGVTFPTNGHVIKTTLYGSLNDIATVLNMYPETRIVISGNTDNTGNYDYNVNLSLKRGESVRKYLIGKGVDPHRFQVIGNGPDLPIASNNTESGRSQNRRVEIQIFPNQ